jgi:hypothetical protein
MSSPSPALHRSGGNTLSNAFKTPSLLADAIDALAAIAREHAARDGLEIKQVSSEVVRIMNLVDWAKVRTFGYFDVLSFYSYDIVQPLLPDRRNRNVSYSGDRDGEDNRGLGPGSRRSMLVFRSASHLVSPDRALAERYQILGSDLVHLCDLNASIARNHGRYDHEHTFKLLRPLVAMRNGQDFATKKHTPGSDRLVFIHNLIITMYVLYLLTFLLFLLLLT